MKLSELRPCDNCGGQISPVFNLVTCDIGAVNPVEARTNLGLTQMFGGALGLAEVMSPTPDCVKLASDKPETAPLRRRLFLCMECWCKPICLGEVLEKVSDRKYQIE